MSEPQAYLNGKIIPASAAMLSVADAGFVQGTTVAEQLRTFGGKLFRLDKHLERLYRSLAIVEVDPGVSIAELHRAAEELVAHNHALLAPGDDLGLSLFVTPGIYPNMIPGANPGPTVCLHTFPLRFDLWADKYEQGESLATTEIVQVPDACWPPELKCRSRMHYFLADRQARKKFPGSRALMLDQHGFVVEATTANIVLFRGDSGLLLPPAEKVLPGISLAVVHELAKHLEMPVVERDLTVDDVLAADEVYLTSTSPCMLPVVNVNGQPIGAGVPGPVLAQFLAFWSELVGLNIVEQAEQFAKRE